MGAEQLKVGEARGRSGAKPTRTKCARSARSRSERTCDVRSASRTRGSLGRIARFAPGLCGPSHAALRFHDPAVGVPAVPGAANHRQADPALVRRHLRSLDHVPRVLPGRAPGWLHLRPCGHAATFASPAIAAAHRAVAREPAVPADRAQRGAEACGRCRRRSAHHRAAGGNDRTAVLPAVDNRPAAAEVGRAEFPREVGLPPLCAVELRLAARVAGVSFCDRTVLDLERRSRGYGARPMRCLCSPARSRRGTSGAGLRRHTSCRSTPARYADDIDGSQSRSRGPGAAGSRLFCCGSPSPCSVR